MPRLWTTTIEAHRDAVRDAIIRTAAELAQSHGLRSVTMSKIAQEAGIGRATLYKYFADVEAIMIAWHHRQISHHLQQLATVSERAGTPGERLEAVLEAYALLSYESRRHRDGELAALLHADAEVARAEHQLRHFVRRLVVEATAAGDVRDDVSPDELVNFCLHALAAATGLRSKAGVRRLVALTLTGMHSAAAQ